MKAVIASKKVRPLKYHGGKHYLAKWIISHFPPHLSYVELFFGGGRVLFARDPNRDWFIDDEWRSRNGDKVPASLKGCSEVVNDIYSELMNFWSILAHETSFEKFIRIVEATPFSQEHWRQCSTAPEKMLDPVMSAVAFFVKYRQSRQGLGEDFATLSQSRTRRGINEHASSWLSVIDGLPEAHNRLKGVVILCDDALKVIDRQDGGDTLFYCDPPYMHDTRTKKNSYGRFEMTNDDHKDLLLKLRHIKGKFILSGYDNFMYNEFYKAHGWRKEEKVVPNSASSNKKKELKTECLWMNF